jgi:hypothetical protein
MLRWVCQHLAVAAEGRFVHTRLFFDPYMLFSVDFKMGGSLSRVMFTQGAMSGRKGSVDTYDHDASSSYMLYCDLNFLQSKGQLLAD